MVRIESFKFQNKKRSKIYCKIEEMPDILVINVRRQKTQARAAGSAYVFYLTPSWHLVQNILILKNRRDKKIFFIVHALERELPSEK